MLLEGTHKFLSIIVKALNTPAIPASPQDVQSCSVSLSYWHWGALGHASLFWDQGLNMLPESVDWSLVLRFAAYIVIPWTWSSNGKLQFYVTQILYNKKPVALIIDNNFIDKALGLASSYKRVKYVYELLTTNA